jgi:alpha-beta hydrolase superfamily lysophospholipase
MRRWAGTLLTALAASLATAAPAGAAATGCDQACQDQWAWQRQDALPRTSFYDGPRPLPWAAPGALIRSQRTTEYAVPAAATRMLYHSRTSAGRDVAASGVVLVPPGTPPKTGWPVVVDAHGSSGIGQACAPSLMRDLYHGDQMTRLLQSGWAVVAPDYAGLGTTGRPEFLNRTGEADDVIDSMRAARQARLGLSSRWVLWGHSQGGGAALAVAERQRRQPQPGYLGTVVTSPTADLTSVVGHMAGTPGLGGSVPLVVRGASFSDPRVQPGRVLTSAAMERLPVTGEGCLGVVSAVYGDLTGPSLVRPGFLADPAFARYLKANSTGRGPIGGPILLLQGSADSLVPQAATGKVAAALCRTDARVTYRVYPGLEHDTYPGKVTGIDDGAMPAIRAWIAGRFAGEPAGSTCR